MDDYLKKYGLTPTDLGMDNYLKNYHKPEKTTTISKSDKMHSDITCTNAFGDTKLRDLPLTMAYVPMQPLTSTYEQDEALKSGTLFPNLDKPFLGRKP